MYRIVELIRRTPESNIILFVNYTSIKKKGKSLKQLTFDEDV